MEKQSRHLPGICRRVQGVLPDARHPVRDGQRLYGPGDVLPARPRVELRVDGRTVDRVRPHEQQAMGYGGEFEVETTFKDDRIQDIIIKEHNETPSIGGVALEQMITAMKEKNHYDVDTISGATKSSQALKEAVIKAYEKAKNES